MKSLSLFASIYRICLLVGLSFPLIAQLNTPIIQLDSCQLKLIANVKSDSITLRWAPNNASAWERQLHNGYLIERYEIPDDTSKEISSKRLTNEPLKPFSKEIWLSKFGKTNNLAIVAASQLYPELNTDTQLNTISIIQGNNKLITSHGFALFAADNDPMIATAEGLRYVDLDIKKNTKYLYKVYYPVSIPEIYCDTAYVYVNSSELTLIPLISAPNINIFDNKIELHWNAGIVGGFSAFHIERSIAGKSEFKRLNKNPFISFHEAGNNKNEAYFTDSIPNYISYEYRIIGITAFGEHSKPSELVKGMARDLTPPATAVITGVSSEGKTALKINWKLSALDDDLKSLEIAHSNDVNGPFNTISEKLNTSIESFIDLNPDPYLGNFYVVISRDTAGNIATSLPFYGIVEDDSPPKTPLGLTGYVDTSSIVHLRWNIGLEPDLLGYRVYGSNAADHEFSNLTPEILQDTTFIDTIVKRTLTKYIYYRIAAVDNNYNHSDYSPIIQIRRLDVIPPVSPRFDKVLVNDTSVVMSWINSSSDDVKEQLLYRKAKSDSIWFLIYQWPTNRTITSYVDKNLPKKTFFEYKLIAVDSTDLRSDETSIISVRTYDNGSRPSITDIALNYNSENKTSVLSWNYNQVGEYSILIFRALPGKPLTKFKMLKSEISKFEDKQVAIKGEYVYALKAIYKDGGESVLSNKFSCIVE